MEEVKKQGMESLFVPYEIALALKELGFDEPCFTIFLKKEFRGHIGLMLEGFPINSETNNIDIVSAPTFSQCFRWFREKHGLYHSIGLDGSLENDVNCDYQIINHNQSISELETDFKSYEQAELECLKKLIEIVKEKQ